MKILHLPTTVGGNAFGLSRAERELGLQSDTLYRTQDWLGYPGDIVLSRSNNPAFVLLKSAVASLYLPQRYDVLHFNFGSTLVDSLRHGINHWDLPLYRHKKLVVTYNGCDARQRFVRMQQTEISACRHERCYDGICADETLDRNKRRRISQFEEAGAAFFALNPDLMYVLPKGTHFLPYTISEWNRIEQVPILQKPNTLTIVHAPTNRVCKGTDAALSSIKMLQERYPNRIRLLLVENMSHDQALQAYKQADIVLDQLRCGWYGALAVECMKMGKPVIAYINSEDLHFLPAQMAKDCMDAFINANEFTLYQILEQFIVQPDRLLRLREAALDYVHRWHNPISVAAITKEVYEQLQGSC